MTTNPRTKALMSPRRIMDGMMGDVGNYGSNQIPTRTCV